MSWKYQSNLKKSKIGINMCSVQIYCDDWELYERLVKIVEKELEK